MPEMKSAGKIHKHTKFHTDSLNNKKSYSKFLQFSFVSGPSPHASNQHP